MEINEVSIKREKAVISDSFSTNGYDYAIVIRTDGVKVIEASGFELDDKITDVRFFSKEKEAHFVKMCDGTYSGRVLEENHGENKIRYYEEEQLLWGKLADNALSDERGMKIELPQSLTENCETDSKYTITVRNYLSADTFEFIDSAVVGIQNLKGEGK